MNRTPMLHDRPELVLAANDELILVLGIQILVDRGDVVSVETRRTYQGPLIASGLPEGLNTLSASVPSG